MFKINETLVLLSLLTLSGCMTASFIPSGAQTNLKPKTENEIETFFSATDVPYTYKPIGKIFMNLSSRASGDQQEQINEIKRKAAEVGADGVILSSSLSQTGPLLRRRSIDKFEAIAFIKTK